MKNEEWRDIKDYEGHYQVSNIGRVKSLSRLRKTKGGGNCLMPEKIMKLHIHPDKGRQRPYASVLLRKNETRDVSSRHFLVHRLVAAAFIRPLELKEQVDHINGKHSDNDVENLRILTEKEHCKLNPTLRRPQLKNIHSGRFVRQVEDVTACIPATSTAKQIYHIWHLNNVSRQNYWGT